MINRHNLESLRILRFRGLADVSLNDLGAFNLFLGANDVGKTSVLEAVFLLIGLSNEQLPIRIQHNRQYPVSSFEDISYLFHNLNTDLPIELSGTLRGANETRKSQVLAREADTYPHERLPSQHLRSQNNGNRVRKPDMSAQIASSSLSGSQTLSYRAIIDGSDNAERVAFEGEWDFASSEGIRFKTQPNAQRSLIIPAQFVYPWTDYKITSMDKLVRNKMTKKLLSILRHINPQIQSVTTIGEVVYLDVGLDRMIPLNMFGSGMARAAHVFAQCISGESRVLLIDEIENGLHHEGVSAFLKAILAAVIERTIQVFATTHRLELLQILQGLLSNEEYATMRSEVRCFVLAKDSDDRVRAYRYDYDQFDHCIRQGIEIR